MLKSDPETAEVDSNYAQILDPYGVHPDLPEECRQRYRSPLSKGLPRVSNMTRRTRSKTLGSAQVGSATKADTIKRDLNQRKAKNQMRMKLERELERFVLDLDLDWDAFHNLLFEAFEDVACDHDHTLCRRILVIMALGDEAIQACLTYFTLQGGGCDCEVDLNVDMTEPQPLVDFGCEDCASEYDEYYMVQNDIWKAYGAGKGKLCIGCLEKRIGRKLCRQDFSDAPINEINPETQSLRLQDRLSTGGEATMDAKQAALLEAYWQYHRHHGMTEDGRKKMHETVDKLVAEGDKFLLDKLLDALVAFLPDEQQAAWPRWDDGNTTTR